jgi:hypothetical protein
MFGQTFRMENRKWFPCRLYCFQPLLKHLQNNNKTILFPSLDPWGKNDEDKLA